MNHAVDRMSARNLRDEIVRQMRHIGDWGGKFIIPIPDVHVIEPSRSVS